jgi:hypothetical protein
VHEIRGDALVAKGDAQGARAEYAAALEPDAKGQIDRPTVELKLRDVGGESLPRRRSQRQQQQRRGADDRCESGSRSAGCARRSCLPDARRLRRQRDRSACRTGRSPTRIVHRE